MESGGPTALSPPIFFMISLLSHSRLLNLKTSLLSTLSYSSTLLTATLLRSMLQVSPKTLERCMAKPLGQLVCVSSMYHYTYTPHLSTS